MSTLNYQKRDEAGREVRKQFRLKWFGPSKAEVWRQLAAEIGANYTERTFWKGDRVTAEVGHWQIVLDVYHVDKAVYTRIRAPYVNADGFRFKVFRTHLFSGVAEMLGLQDVNVGYPEFDEQFVIRGTHESKLRQLFANPRIRELIMAQPKISFRVDGGERLFWRKFPEGVDELQFIVGGIIKDIDRLKLLYDLFAETLQTLCEMGSAYERDPEVEL
jgi:hypothetical protein